MVLQFRRPARGLREEQTGEEEFIFDLTGSLIDQQVLVWPEGGDAQTGPVSAGPSPEAEASAQSPPVGASPASQAEVPVEPRPAPSAAATHAEVSASPPPTVRKPGPPPVSQPITIGDMELAGRDRRFGASLIDSLFAFGIFIVSFAGFFGLEPEEEASDAAAAWVFVVWVGIIAFWLYGASKGWSPGKLAVGIRIVTMDGDQPGWGKALLRETIGKAVASSFMLFGFVWILLDPQRRGWHDKMAGTIVVRKK